MLTSPSLSELNLEGTTLALLEEWLHGYFDGGAHAIGANATRVFPLAALRFQQSDVPQPLNGAAITAVWSDPADVRKYWDTVEVNGVRTRQERTTARATLNFWVRAETPATANTNARLLCQQVANLLFALLGNSAATHPLSQKGLHHWRPRPARMIAETAYSLRLVTCAVELRYAVLSQITEGDSDESAPVSAAPFYVGIRTDGLPGTGTTALDPFDGSTAAKFDLLMRGFPENSVIILGAGVFQTTGCLAYNEVLGWEVKAGWDLRGQGNPLTTIKRIAWPVWPSAISHGVIQMSMYATGNATISDLTVDENWPALGAAAANVSFAVQLYGSNCTLRRVRPINGYGNHASLMEAFCLSICARHNGTAWENGVDALIEDCEVASFRGDYGFAICLIGDPLGGVPAAASMQGIVRNNRVSGFYGTAAFGMSGDTLFEGNVTISCRRAFYNDTGLVQNSIIRNNQLLDTAWPAIHLVPSLGAAYLSDVLIEGNIIQTNGSLAPSLGVALSAAGPGHLANITIRDNTFLLGTPGPASPRYAIQTAFTAGVLVEDNTVDAGLVSQVIYPEYPSTEVVIRGNRTPAGGVPDGLADFP